MGRVIEAFAQFFDNAGDPLTDGWLRFLESGTNNTDKNTYADSTLQTLNTNPLQLDGAGRCPSAFGSGSYRVISYTDDPLDEGNPGEQVQQFDPVTAQISSSGGGGGGSGVDEWDAGTTYSLGDLVIYNGKYYKSLANDNSGNNPGTEELYWEQVEFIPWWNSTVTYNTGDTARNEDHIYLSKKDDNLNNDPATDFIGNWFRFEYTLLDLDAKTEDYEILVTEDYTAFALAPGTTAPRTFTLPDVSEGEDRFRLVFVNAADYDLTIVPQGSASLWYDPSNTMVMQKGGFVDIRYSYAFDMWVPMHNLATILGGQDIATSTYRALTVYTDILDVNTATINTNLTSPLATITTLNATTFTVDTANITTGNITDINCSGTAALTVITGTTLTMSGLSTLPEIAATTVNITGTTTGVRLNLTGDIHQGDNLSHYFGTGDDASISFDGTNLDIVSSGAVEFQGAWQVLSSTGDLIPVDITKNLGSATNEIGFIYALNIEFGLAQDGHIYHDSTDMFINTDVGNMIIGTADVSYVAFTTQDLARWLISSDGHILPVFASYDIGATTGEIGNVYLASSKYVYFGTDQDGRIGYDGSAQIVLASASGSGHHVAIQSDATIIFYLSGSPEWYINPNFYPASDNSSDVGQSTRTVKDIWAKGPYNTVVTGEDVYVASTGLFGHLSSLREHKENIVDIPDTSWIYDLKPKQFTRIDDEDGIKEYGFIADEVEPINDHFISYHDGVMAGVKYREINIALLAEVQRLNERLNLLEQ